MKGLIYEWRVPTGQYISALHPDPKVSFYRNFWKLKLLGFLFYLNLKIMKFSLKKIFLKKIHSWSNRGIFKNKFHPHIFFVATIPWFENKNSDLRVCFSLSQMAIFWSIMLLICLRQLWMVNTAVSLSQFQTKITKFYAKTIKMLNSNIFWKQSSRQK